MLSVNRFTPQILHKNATNKKSVAFSSFYSLELEQQQKLAAKEIQEKFSDVLGDNFIKNFLTPLEKFLSKKPTNVKLRIVNFENATTDDILRIGKEPEKNLFYAFFERKRNIKKKVMHSNPSIGITKNNAIVALFNNYLDGGVPLKGLGNPLRKAEVPPVLRERARQIQLALEEFRQKYYENPEATTNPWAFENMKKHLELLMPDSIKTNNAAAKKREAAPLVFNLQFNDYIDKM